MADLGADVIKIEERRRAIQLPDYRPNPQRRAWPAAFSISTATSAASCSISKQPAGCCCLAQARLRQPMSSSIARPKAIDKLGLGYQAVRASQAGYHLLRRLRASARRGLIATRRAYDDIIQAGSGLAALHMARARRADASCRLCCATSYRGQAIAYSVMAALVPAMSGGGGAGHRGTDVRDHGGVRLYRASAGLCL